MAKATTIKRDASAERCTPKQLEVIEMLKGEVDAVEFWYDETDSTMGVTSIDDEMILVGFFDHDGNLIGDWV